MSILQARDTDIFNSQHEMQYVFKHGKSPSMASLALTEAICENPDAHQPTYVAAWMLKISSYVVYTCREGINTGATMQLPYKAQISESE